MNMFWNIRQNAYVLHGYFFEGRDKALMPKERKTDVMPEGPIMPNCRLQGMRFAKELQEAYISVYRKETDEQLYQRVRNIAAELGRLPMKSELPAFVYLKARLGNWPIIMEQAGLKQVSERRRRIMEQREEEKKKISVTGSRQSGRMGACKGRCG